MNASTVLARAVVAALVRGGVRDVVLCPGSRSAPLAFAAARLADAGVVRLHVRLDERSAGFLALGMAKTSARPVAVVCTSGTAVANLMPAVVEASYAAIPVVVVSADRPVEARGVGAPQTIDQIELFGDTVRCFADLGASTSAVEAADEARMAVRRALEVAAGQRHSSSAFTSSGHSGLGVPTRRGPVHLNVGFRLPLAPDPDVLADPIEPEEVAHSLGPSESDVAGTSLEQPDDEPIHQSPRGVVLAGDLPGTSRDATHQAVLRLARSNGWPILAEPTANLQGLDNVLGHAPLVLGTPWQDQHVPDLVLSMGAFGLSRPTLALLRSAGTHVAIDLPSIGREVCDPVRSAERVLGRVPELSQHSRPDPAWLASWLAADEIAGSVVGAHLERTRGSRARAQAHGIRPNSALEPGPSPTSSEAHGPGTNLPFPPDVLTGGAVAREVYRTAPADGLLLLAASWPVRHVEALGGRRTGLRVIGNRGANGIDGLVSTAWGAALAHQREGGARALALMGDLAFLHDHNGLLAGVDEERPDLTIVVVDNDGGGIFSQLEQGGPAYASQFDRLFATPQGRDLVEVARAAGVPALRVTTRTALSAALEEASHAVRVIVADVPGFSGDLSLMSAIEADLAVRLPRDER